MNEDAAHVLDVARNLITSERAEQYGSYVDETKKEAEIIKTLTGLDIKPFHIPLILIVVKLVRESAVHKDDNMVDACGYAALYNQIKELYSEVKR